MSCVLAIFIALVVGFAFSWVAKKRGLDPVKWFIVGAAAVAAVIAIGSGYKKRKRG